MKKGGWKCHPNLLVNIFCGNAGAYGCGVFESDTLYPHRRPLQLEPLSRLRSKHHQLRRPLHQLPHPSFDYDDAVDGEFCTVFVRQHSHFQTFQVKELSTETLPKIAYYYLSVPTLSPPGSPLKFTLRRCSQRTATNFHANFVP
jgi:hypothetical protein